MINKYQLSKYWLNEWLTDHLNEYRIFVYVGELVL
jgi:hypothetical protein